MNKNVIIMGRVGSGCVRVGRTLAACQCVLRYSEHSQVNPKAVRILSLV